MGIIDSANMSCDNCNVVVNHHIMYWPDGWLRVNDRYLCPKCIPLQDLSGQYNEEGMKLIEE